MMKHHSNIHPENKIKNKNRLTKVFNASVVSFFNNKYTYILGTKRNETKRNPQIFIL